MPLYKNLKPETLPCASMDDKVFIDDLVATTPDLADLAKLPDVFRLLSGICAASPYLKQLLLIAPERTLTLLTGEPVEALAEILARLEAQKAL